MNRRSFFKKVGIVLAGVVALPSKAVGRKRSGTRPATEDEIQNALNEVVKDKLCSGQNGTLCSRCKFNLDRIPVDEGLEEAFCYSGKLFRVYNLGCYKILQIRHDKWINRVPVDSRQFLNREYRDMVCEAMLKSLERKLKQEQS